MNKMSRMKKIVVSAVFMVCTSAGAAFALINTNPVFDGYVCDSQTRKCTCTGASDCYDMGKSNECSPFGGGMSCNPGNTSCSCDWWMH